MSGSSVVIKGSGTLTQQTVDSALNTQTNVDVIIKGFSQIGVDAFKNRTLSSITIPNTINDIGLGAFAGITCPSITLPIRFYSILQQVNLLDIYVSNKQDSNYFSPSWDNQDVKDVVYYSWAINMAHSFQSSSMGNQHLISEQVYNNLNSGAVAFEYLKQTMLNAYGSSSAKRWASWFLGTQSVSTIPLQQAQTRLSKSGTIFYFTFEFTNTSNLTTNIMKTQLNTTYQPGQTLGGVIQPSIPYLSITFDSSVTAFDSKLSFTGINISEVVFPDIPDIYTAFSGNTTLRSVHFAKTNAKSMTYIPPYAFQNCSALQYINLPKYITTIDAYAFQNCSNLVGSPSMILNLENIISIQTYAFASCKIPYVKLNMKQLTHIGTYAFSNSGIIGINLPTNNNFNTIKLSSFYNCTKLQTIHIPKNVQIIKSTAFSGCSNLTNVTLETGLTTIDYSAFSSCSSLALITVPPSITFIDYDVFSNCAPGFTCVLPVNFLEIEITELYNHPPIVSDEPSAPFARWQDKVFGQNANIKLEFYYIFAPLTTSSNILTQADVFTLINKYNLSNVDTVGPFNVYIADNVTTIDNYAFKMVKNLNTIIINNVQIIGDGAFEGSGLYNFYVGPSIDSITDSQLTTIGKYAFNNCNNITSFVIPSSVTEIGDFIFYNSVNLREVIFDPSTTIKKINNYAFTNCIGLNTLRIPNSVQHIGDYAFAYCVNLYNIVLPNTLQYIGEKAFYRCKSIQTLNIPYNTIYIGNDAFGEIPFDSNSGVLISSKFKNNINSIFNISTYTGEKLIFYNDYQKYAALFQYYIILKNGATAIVNSSMGDYHNLVEQVGYFNFNGNEYFSNLFCSQYLETRYDQKCNNPNFDPDDINDCPYQDIYQVAVPCGTSQYKAKPFARDTYLKEDPNTGTTPADTNINTNYALMKNAQILLSGSSDTIVNVDNSIFKYHYKFTSDTGILTKADVSNQLGNAINTSFTASLDDNITKIDLDAFSGLSITNMNFNHKITSIGDSAFKDCVSLIGKIIIPSSVTHIGAYAFSGCIGVDSIMLLDGALTRIDKYAFANTSISHIYIPKSVTHIGDFAFNPCLKLNTITFPLERAGSLSTIDVSTSTIFSQVASRTIQYSVNIYPSEEPIEYNGTQYNNAIDMNIVTEAMSKANADTLVTVIIRPKNSSNTDKIEILPGAFQNNKNIYRMTMLNVKKIHDNAFAGCLNLTSLSMDNHIEQINEGAFFGCNNLQRVKIPSRLFESCNNNYFTSNQPIIYLFFCILSSDNDGILTQSDVEAQLGVNNTFTSTISLIFDKSVTIIDDYAFSGNNYISTIFIVPNIISINDYAFSNCSNLKSVMSIDNGSSNLINIGSHAFSGCSQLNTVMLPMSLLNIQLGAFLGCDNLWTVTLPSIFDYDLVVKNNLFFESNMMKDESWSSNNQDVAQGTFFTFNFQTISGQYYSYSWAKSNYIYQQKVLQAEKIAAHEKHMAFWNSVAEYAIGITVAVAIAFTGGAATVLTPALEALGEGVSMLADAAGMAATDAVEDAASNAVLDAVKQGVKKIGEKYYENIMDSITEKYMIDPITDGLDYDIFGDDGPDDTNVYSVSQLTNRETTYGSMNAIYNVTQSILNSVSTNHSNGSWILTTTITIADHDVKLNVLLNIYNEVITNYFNTNYPNISINTNKSHILNPNHSHQYTLTTTIPIDYTTISETEKSIISNAINNALLQHLKINTNTNNISTIVSNICFPKKTLIKTDQETVFIENININKHTINNKPIIAITKTISTDKYLICFKKNALGNNIPIKDTIMSKDHKIDYRGKMFEAKEFLNKNNSNVYKVKYNGEILYNILLDNYSTVNVNNLLCETLHPDNIIAKIYKDNNNIQEKNKINIQTKKGNNKKKINNHVLKKLKFI